MQATKYVPEYTATRQHNPVLLQWLYHIFGRVKKLHKPSFGHLRVKVIGLLQPVIWRFPPSSPTFSLKVNN